MNIKIRAQLKKIALALSIVLSVSLIGCKETSAQESTLVEPQELINILETKEVHLVDVRTPKEFNKGFIENSINIDFSSPTFKEEIRKLDTSKPIVVYCRSGRRSAISTKTLVKVGFTEIYDLKGGIINWKREGYQLVKP